MTKLAELVALVAEFEKLDGSIQAALDNHDGDIIWNIIERTSDTVGQLLI